MRRILTLAALAHVALEYRKIVELLDLVEACTTDPAKIRGAVEEQVASRGGGCFGDVENYLFAGPVANVLAAPPPAVVAAGHERSPQDVHGGAQRAAVDVAEQPRLPRAGLAERAAGGAAALWIVDVYSSRE